ncbi:quinone oxidoreductase family protein [Mesorhizobium comanense]|uniref:quinone oxidoreductase family protein n=1 Tax=Mesorhizobium comanense TaxID=2502215 RepID=UPI0010F801A0|nr:zinc-binding alcohol dehydrogenase family protein [Mesorhizobium comanense]
MKAAIVPEAGRTPVYGDVPEPAVGPGEQLVHVSAAAVSHVVKSRASGTHYSSSGRFPFVVGVDGVGRLENGRRVYFVAPGGSMAERAAVPSAYCLPLPDELDDVTAAAIANPGMSSWAAYVERAKLKAGETVLVNGAAGSSGRLAVQIARHLGARKVIATARNVDALKEVAALGADMTVPLVEDQAALEASLKKEFAQGIDVVIDYLWGKSAERLLVAAAKAGPEAVPIRFVQIGSMSGSDIMLSSAVLRSSAITLMGSGIGSIPMERLVACVGALLEAAVPAGFKIAAKPVPLADVERAWAEDDSARRTVFTLEPDDFRSSRPEI